MNSGIATREVYWNITHVWVMYLLLIPTLLIAAYGFYRRITLWRRGQPLARFDHPRERVIKVLRHALLQQATWRKVYAGAFHAMIFWGMIVLTAATTIVMIQEDLCVPIMHGRFYLWFQSLTVDCFGAFALVGIGMAMARRWILRSKQLVFTWEASALLVLFFVILASGFLLEGWRIAATNDPWGSWSPFGNLVAKASKPWLNNHTLHVLHATFWWSHLVMVFGLLAWSPYTKMAHVVTSVLNLYTARLTPIGAALRPVDFDKEGALGINSLAGFAWKDLLDFDACTECGRCTAACPANRVGKVLSPRDLILDLQHIAGPEADFAAPIIGKTQALSQEALWACTTCGACVRECPVAIEQLPKIIDMRRHLAMEQAEMPDTMATALASLEARGHPFAGTQFSRVDWAKGLNVPQRSEIADCEVLLWVGCGGALVERNQKVVRAIAQLLEKAGVKFAILGREEKCTGDPARRIGQEFLFQTLATQNIATMERYQVKTVVTSCPHCFNTLRNEYPALGGNYDVFHHSEYLDRLVNEGKLTPEAESTAKVTFHDPCYLGRQNGIYDPPRRLTQISVRSKPLEMTESRERSFCCGGGGGLSFAEEPPNQRVNRERARQVVETGADVVAVGCPFCMTMLEDGVKACAGGEQTRVQDVAELLWDAVRERE